MIRPIVNRKHFLVPACLAVFVPCGHKTLRGHSFHKRPLEYAHAIQTGRLDHFPAVLLPARASLAIRVALLELIIYHAFHCGSAILGNPYSGLRRVRFLQGHLHGLSLHFPHCKLVGHNILHGQLLHLLLHHSHGLWLNFRPKFLHQNIIRQHGIRRGLNAPVLEPLRKKQIHEPCGHGVHLGRGHAVKNLRPLAL